jgi:hypothetical protein
MERLRYRSTSLIDIQAELRQQDLLRESRPAAIESRERRRPLGLPFGLRLLRRRTAR